MKAKKILAIATTLLLIPGCASMFEYRPYARNVKKQPGDGGVIALHTTHRDEDRQLAQTMMGKNCQDRKVTILEEGEVVIGTTTTSNSEMHKGNKEKVGSVFGMPIMSGNDGETNTSSETLEKKEWQIRYKCS